MSNSYGFSGHGALRQAFVWTLGSDHNCGTETNKYRSCTQIGKSASDLNFYLYSECPNTMFRDINYMTTDMVSKPHRSPHGRLYHHLEESDKSIEIEFGYIVYNPTLVPCIEFHTDDIWYLKINKQYYISDKIESIRSISRGPTEYGLIIQTSDKQEYKLKSFSRWKNIAAQLELENITEYI
jgi:hypothetical protein